MSPNNDYQIDIPTTFFPADQTEIFYEGRKMEYDKTSTVESVIILTAICAFLLEPGQNIAQRM